MKTELGFTKEETIKAIKDELNFQYGCIQPRLLSLLNSLESLHDTQPKKKTMTMMNFFSESLGETIIFTVGALTEEGIEEYKPEGFELAGKVEFKVPISSVSLFPYQSTSL
jgi:hypothetical protein